MEITYEQRGYSRSWIFTIAGQEFTTRQLADKFGICRTTIGNHAKNKPPEVVTRFLEEHWERVSLGELSVPDIVQRDGVRYWRRLGVEYTVEDVMARTQIREASAVTRLCRWSCRQITTIDLFANNHNGTAAQNRVSPSTWGNLGLGPRRSIESIQGPTACERSVLG